MSARHRKCPTPDKRQYVAKEQALRTVRGMTLGRGEIRAYRCRKHWHLTSRPA